MSVADPPALYAQCLTPQGDWANGFFKGDNQCVVMVDMVGLPFSGVRLRTLVYTRKVTWRGFHTRVTETDSEQYNAGQSQVVFTHNFSKSATASLLKHIPETLQSSLNSFAKAGLTNLAAEAGFYLGTQLGVPETGAVIAGTYANRIIPDQLLSKFDTSLRNVLGEQVVAVQYNVAVCDFQMLDCSDESTGVLELLR